MAVPAGPTCTPVGAAPGLAYTLTFLAFFAQAIEGLIRLPDWAGARGMALEAAGFGNAVLGLILLAAVVFGLGRTFQFSHRMQIVVAVVTAILIAVAGLLLVVSLATGSLVPGSVPALFGVLPLSAWLMRRLPLGPIEKARAGLLGSALMPGLTAAVLWIGGASG